jgi:D-alanine-D-alanine ligase
MKSLPSGEKDLVIQDQQVDVFFPIIHGTFGEDGCLQGLFELLDVAYVGAGVLGSAVGMDKDVQKRLLIQAGIPVAKYQVIKKEEWLHGYMATWLKYPCFVKPANMGSSVGITKVNKAIKLIEAIKLAFQYDTKVIIEEEVKGRELEVAVLDGKASLPGEVIPKGHEFYDYEAKYIDEKGAELKIPAKLSKEQSAKIRKLAEKTFEVLECEGMARVDLFMRPNGELVINEINTLPGFTSISMYPKLWEASGVSYPELLDRLINLAIKRKKEKDKLKRSY